MKRILVVCGTGVATSTVVLSKIKDWLADKGYTASLSQEKVADAITKLDNYDIVVSTTIVPDNIRDRVISGLALITGINSQEVFDKIEVELKK